MERREGGRERERIAKIVIYMYCTNMTIKEYFKFDLPAANLLSVALTLLAPLKPVTASGKTNANLHT